MLTAVYSSALPDAELGSEDTIPNIDETTPNTNEATQDTARESHDLRHKRTISSSVYGNLDQQIRNVSHQ